MNHTIHYHFAIALLIAVAWTMLFSLTNNVRIRGFRNLGLLACYLMLPIFWFIGGTQALRTWAVFGLAGGLIYILWEVIHGFRAATGDTKLRVNLKHFVFGLLAWPIMIPEAMEYSFAELGLLRPPSTPPGSPTTAGEQINLDAPLSPEADKFLGEAMAECNAKQETMWREWRIKECQQWNFDQTTGLLRIDFEDGRQFQADGQVLGSYFASRHSWEWAWNNPHVEPAMAHDSNLVKQLGERLKIGYLLSGMVPIPSEELMSYLCAIGVKATDSLGVFRAKAGDIDVMIALKNPRWGNNAALRGA